jgi:hypothetical protein
MAGLVCEVNLSAIAHLSISFIVNSAVPDTPSETWVRNTRMPSIILRGGALFPTILNGKNDCDSK